jgi:RNA polymerase sigma factor (sigma-70 family)
MYSFVVRPICAPQQNATVNRISSGDNDARFRRVVLPHLDDAYSLARWLTGDRADAEDVVQEACLRAFRGIGGFAGINSRAWFLTVVRHAAYTWLGKNRSSALVMVDDPDAVEQKQAGRGVAPRDGPETPEAALIAKTDAARLERAIAELPLPFRETLVLRDVQALDYREIAEVTKVPIGTVMSRLARARRRLIAIIAKDEVSRTTALCCASLTPFLGRVKSVPNETSPASSPGRAGTSPMIISSISAAPMQVKTVKMVKIPGTSTRSKHISPFEAEPIFEGTASGF